jgi:hypothetical protein
VRSASVGQTTTPGVLADLSRRGNQLAAQNNYLDQYYMDGSYIKLREVSASYDIPERWLRGTKTAFTLRRASFTRGPISVGLDPDGQVGPSTRSGHTAAQSNSRHLNVRW